ncbi:MAG: hypothetical protein AAF556_01195 [Pseudomonadota bacterium]
MTGPVLIKTALLGLGLGLPIAGACYLWSVHGVTVLLAGVAQYCF